MVHVVETFADTAIVVGADAAKLEPVNAINAATIERYMRDLLDMANSSGVESNLATFEQLVCSLANRTGPTNNQSFISFEVPTKEPKKTKIPSFRGEFDLQWSV
jgi:hypothetical protein